MKKPESPRRAVAFFTERFRALGTADRAVNEKAYLKSELQFHGVRMPDLRRVAVEWCKAHPDLDRDQLRAVVDALMATDFHDLRSAGIAVLERKAKLLEAKDAPWLIDLVRHTHNWAHVDWLAAKVVGGLVERNPPLLRTLRRWARDDDGWVRRTALLAQLDVLRHGAGDFDLFAELATPMLDDKWFFIRKAIGWVLREVSKKRPELVFAFLREHGARASGLTFREGSKYLPKAMLDSLTAR